MPKEKVENNITQPVGEDSKLKEITRLENKITMLANKMNLCVDEIIWHSEHGTSDYHEKEIRDHQELYEEFETMKKNVRKT